MTQTSGKLIARIASLPTPALLDLLRQDQIENPKTESETIVRARLVAEMESRLTPGQLEAYDALFDDDVWMATLHKTLYETFKSVL